MITNIHELNYYWINYNHSLLIVGDVVKVLEFVLVVLDLGHLLGGHIGIYLGLLLQVEIFEIDLAVFNIWF